MAATTFDAGDIGNFVQTPFTDLGPLMGSILQIVIILGGILFFIFFLIGGLQWLTSGGDKTSLENARGKITSALTGLIIILAAFAIIKILETAFGIRIISGITLNGP